MQMHNEHLINRNETVSPLLPTLCPVWYDYLALLLGYVVLDWASYIHPLHGLNITVWNPAPALGLLFLLRFGRSAVLPLALAIFIADVWVRNLPVSMLVSLGLSALLALGYWAIAEVLRHRLSSRRIFDDRKDLLQWAGIVSIGTLLNSIIYVATLSIAKLIPIDDVPNVFIRYWIGDGVGVLVSMPILWMLLDPHGRTQLRAMVVTWESLGYLLAACVALWIAFYIGAAADFKYFYVLFLPVMWAAARQGLAGAVISTAIVQLGIISSVQVLDVSAINVLEIQALAAVLALFGFFVGVVVDEKQRVSAELRQTLRLAAAGEMAGALAHELNQPLTALSTYGLVCEKLLGQGETGERLSQAIHCMVAESSRAADVVRRLRDFFRTGATQLETLSLGDLLASAVASFAPKAQQHGIKLIIDEVSPCTIFADRLQLEVVLRNLLSNAFDAVAEQPPGQRHVQVTAYPECMGRVCIRIEDSGPGFSEATGARLFEAFRSAKASGLGLGLVISRAIVEAHGGHLLAEVAAHGLFKVVLPIEGKADDEV